MRTQEKLIYTNERGESIEFSTASSYHVNFKDVTGLSDVRNAIYSTNSMGQDGDTYLGYRIESRDIDIVGYIKERDKQAAQNLRRKLNRILNPQYEATLTYVFGDFRRVIGCKIDDAPIFKRKPIFEQFTVSLSCLNPFWREETETREDIATWIGGFEFPVPDGLELYDGWEIGYRQPSLIVNVYNSGDVKSGIRIEFRAIGAVTNPVLLNVDTREFIKLNISLVAGDVLTVSTGYGEKAVKLNRGGTITDAFRYFYFNTGDLAVELDTADGQLNRIDRVVVRWDLTNRVMSVKVKSSSFSASPTAPALQRDADVYELALADIYVGAGVTAITQSKITDQRLNTSLCGVVAAVVQQIDTAAFNAQLQAWFAEYQSLSAAEYNTLVSYMNSLKLQGNTQYEAFEQHMADFETQAAADFNAWFNGLQNVLDDNAATNLLNITNALDARVDMLEAVLFNDITTNPFLILFDDLDGVTSTGIWNESLQRIEC